MERRLNLCFFILCLLFGRYFYEGLSPDAALYAGLSLKQLLGESSLWLPSGDVLFTPFFHEHPPYFFAWGSAVLAIFGDSDGAARLIGGIPSAIALLGLCFWLQRRLGWYFAWTSFFLLLSFGHFTKYAFSSYLEGGLCLGVTLAYLGTLEYLIVYKRIYPYVLIGLGLFIAVASKGIAGFGAGLGVLLSIGVAHRFFKRKRSLGDYLKLLSLVSFACMLPLALWAFFSKNAPGGAWPFLDYINEQVLRSFTSNRDSPLHQEGGSRFRYLQVILKYGWPWWWTVPASLFLFRKRKIGFHLKYFYYHLVAGTGLCFFLCFFIPFSLSSFQLPHYLHPTYLPLAPVGAACFVHWIPKKWMLRFSAAKTRWVLATLFCVGSFAFFRGDPERPHRGASFRRLQERIQALPEDCPLRFSRQDVDPYKLEAFGLWYLKGRSFAYEEAPQKGLFVGIRPEIPGELSFKSMDPGCIAK